MGAVRSDVSTYFKLNRRLLDFLSRRSLSLYTRPFKTNAGTTGRVSYSRGTGAGIVEAVLVHTRAATRYSGLRVHGYTQQRRCDRGCGVDGTTRGRARVGTCVRSLSVRNLVVHKLTTQNQIGKFQIKKKQKI